MRDDAEVIQCASYSSQSVTAHATQGWGNGLLLRWICEAFRNMCASEQAFIQNMHLGSIRSSVTTRSGGDVCCRNEHGPHLSFRGTDECNQLDFPGPDIKHGFATPEIPEASLQYADGGPLDKCQQVHPTSRVDITQSFAGRIRLRASTMMKKRRMAPSHLQAIHPLPPLSRPVDLAQS